MTNVWRDNGALPAADSSMVYGVISDPDTGIERVVVVRLATALSDSGR